MHCALRIVDRGPWAIITSQAKLEALPYCSAMTEDASISPKVR